MTIQIAQKDIWVFPKCLTHVEVAAIPTQIWNQCPEAGNWTIDLSAVREIDSACLALLLEILRQAIQRQLNLILKDLESRIIALLKVYGIYTLFEKHIR